MEPDRARWAYGSDWSHGREGSHRSDWACRTQGSYGCDWACRSYWTEGCSGSHWALGTYGPCRASGNDRKLRRPVRPERVFVQRALSRERHTHPTGQHRTVVLTTRILSSGFYLVNASINIVNGGTGSYANCYVQDETNPGATGFVSTTNASTSTLSNSDMLAVSSGDSLQLVCSGSPVAGASSNPVWASLTATLVNTVNTVPYSSNAVIGKAVK